LNGANFRIVVLELMQHAGYLQPKIMITIIEYHLKGCCCFSDQERLFFHLIASTWTFSFIQNDGALDQRLVEKSLA